MQAQDKDFIAHIRSSHFEYGDPKKHHPGNVYTVSQ
jgi:hypothetical protein